MFLTEKPFSFACERNIRKPGMGYKADGKIVRAERTNRYPGFERKLFLTKSNGEM